jgi:hypothetical protein
MDCLVSETVKDDQSGSLPAVRHFWQYCVVARPDHQHNAGVRPNNELDRTEWHTTVKQQLTPQDSVLVIANTRLRFMTTFSITIRLSSYRPNFKFEEQQKPILIGAINTNGHLGVRTLVAGDWYRATVDPQAPQLLLIEDAGGAVVAADSQPFDVQVTDDLEIYTAEVNQTSNRIGSPLCRMLWRGTLICEFPQQSAIATVFSTASECFLRALSTAKVTAI